MKDDLIERSAKERAKNFYFTSPQIKTVKLINNTTDEDIICECGNRDFKFYKKIGGLILGKGNKVLSDTVEKYNFICKCGNRLILKEGTFRYTKVKYGCSAVKCAFGKTKMDSDCLKCKYVYEK